MRTKIVLFVYLMACNCVFAYTPQEASRLLAERKMSSDSRAHFYNAVYYGNYELCKLFIDANNIDINRKHLGMTYLLTAILEHHQSIALLLLKSGADPRINSLQNGKSLFYAVRNNQTLVVREILKYPDINIKRQRQLFRLPLITTARIHKNGVMEEMLVNYKKQYEATHSKDSAPTNQASPSDTDRYRNDYI